MIGFAVRAPMENKNWIATPGASLVGFVPPNQTLVRSVDIGVYTKMLTNRGQTTFGLKVNPELLCVPGRILDGPKVMYKAGSNTITPAFGSWNLRNVRLASSAKLTRWTYLGISIPGRPTPWGSLDNLKQAINKFADQMREVGITLSPPIEGLPVSVTPATAEAEINRVVGRFMHSPNQPPPQFLLVLLPQRDTVIYNQVKYTCDVKEGLLNVCVTGKFFQENNIQYLA